MFGKRWYFAELEDGFFLSKALVVCRQFVVGNCLGLAHKPILADNIVLGAYFVYSGQWTVIKSETAINLCGMTFIGVKAAARPVLLRKVVDANFLSSEGIVHGPRRPKKNSSSQFSGITCERMCLGRRMHAVYFINTQHTFNFTTLTHYAA